MSLKNDIIFFVMDSVRYDQFEKARTPNINELAIEIQKSYSTSTWTLPSMHSIIRGIIPSIPKKTLFSEHVLYKTLPEKLKEYDYESYAYSANPVFIEKYFKGIFDKFWYDHTKTTVDSANRLIRQFSNDYNENGELKFAVMLFMETHHPYFGKPKSMPRTGEGRKEFQRDAITYLDEKLKEIYDIVKIGTELYVFSDHGELFNDEDIVFGHDPRVRKDGRPGAIGSMKLMEVFTVKIIKGG